MPLERISGAMVTDGSVTSADVQDGTLTGADVQDGSMTTADLADSAVTTAKLADGAVTRAKAGESLIRLGTLQDTLSGTFKDFTGIPSWARRVTLFVYAVSTNGASDLLVQLGPGTTPMTSGYYACQSTLSYASGIVSTTSAAGIPIFNNLATYLHTGTVVMEKIDASLNQWLVTGKVLSSTGVVGSIISSGIAPLSGPLGMMRLTTALGTPAFDAGYAGISWE